MKKSMLNVITLALVLINLVLTVVLTFSLVSTNNKTNNLISKVAKIIDLMLEGHLLGSGTGNVNIDDIEDKKSKDYETSLVSINNGMKLIVSQITNEALKYKYESVV